jgi:sialate O-acetylesterase
MIVPLLPMSIRSVLWYQGESNIFDPLGYYACMFPAMIQDWRAKWSNNNAPNDFGFFFVQLAPWVGYNDKEAITRLSQLFALQLPKVGFATAIDLHDTESPEGDLHPRTKKEIGERLVPVVRAIEYGENVTYTGPMAIDWKRIDVPESTDESQVTLELIFDPTTIGTGLVEIEPICPSPVPSEQCAGYEILTSQGWVKAQGELRGDKLHVSLALTGNEEAVIEGVRYGHSTYPMASLYNKEGFPAIPYVLPNPIQPLRCVPGSGEEACDPFHNTFKWKLAGLIILSLALLFLILGTAYTFFKWRRAYEALGTAKNEPEAPEDPSVELDEMAEEDLSSDSSSSLE